MDIRQVQHFLSVARHHSFSAAAVALGLTQSAISASLAALERELGATLVNRSAGRRTIELTEAGQAFVEPAKALLDQASAARAAVTAVSSVAAGRVRVATCVVPEQYRVLRTVIDLEVELPDVTVLVTTAGSSDVVQQVSSGQADFGVAAVVPHEHPDFEAQVLVSSPLGLVCRPDHRLAKKDVVKVEDLAGERIIGYPVSQRPRQLMDHWLSQGSLTTGVPAAGLESGEPAVVLDLVRAGKGVSYAPQIFSREDFARGLTAVPLLDAPVWTLAVIARRGGPPTSAAVAVHRFYLAHCRMIQQQ